MADPEPNVKGVRIMLWGVPRSMSTTVLKCLGAIDGMEAWFEPYFYSDFARDRYFEQHHDVLPLEYEGNEVKAVKAAEASSLFLHGAKIEPERIMYSRTKRRLEESESKYVVAKDMASSMQSSECRQYMPSGFRHVFLIRHPMRVFSSFRKAYFSHFSELGLLEGEAKNEATFDVERDNVVFKLNELYRGQLDLWKYVTANVDPDAVVVNTDDLLDDPGQVLSKLCQQVGLPYSDALLQWDESTERVKRWVAAGDELVFNAGPFYDRALQSGSFVPQKAPVPYEEQPADVQRLTAAALPYFNEMDKLKL